MTSQYEKAKSEVEETFNFYTSMLAERKFEVTKEIEKLYSNKQVALSVFGQKIHDSTDKIEQMISFTEKWQKVIPNFHFVIGFSGKFIYRGNETESKGDKYLLDKRGE